ncbi:MAG: VWA domain-containing protein [Planctomycetota bacterium]|nr:VWA domain-containing protein [Planctomycetota bacterium]MDA1214427.1 VWA domain-containing protein [Planctomycetota bacterium]
MEFLHVGILTWFLPIVAIPLVLHLLTLHRLKTVELSTFRFLFDSYVQQRRKMKFLDALIAALRTLFLLLLLLAIARPTVRHWAGLFGSGSGRDIVFMFDCSASMETVTDGIAAIDRAKHIATTILAQLSNDDRVTIVRVTSRPQILSSRFTADSDSLQEQFSGLKTSPARGNLFAAFQQLFSTEADPLLQPQIYLFTDAQESGWREIREQPLQGLFPEKTKLLLVDVGAGNVNDANLAIVGQAPSPHHAIVGLPVVLRPRVSNFSTTTPKDVSVSVLIDDEEIARRRITVPAGETVATDILFTPHHDGVLKGRYQIDGDSFPVDDSFLFTMVVEPRVRVLLVNGVPSADPLMNEGLYLRTAMTTVHPFVADSAEAKQDSPTAKTNSSTPKEIFADEKRLAQILEVREIPEAELTLDVLGDRNVVLLANCGGLNDQQFEWLRNFVFDGGGLLILPGDKVSPDIYNQRFFPVTGVPDQYLIGATLLPSEGDLAQAITFANFASLDLSHPIFAVFDVPDARYLTKVSFFKRYPLKLVEKPGATWPLAELSTGTAAVLEGRHGDGRVILTGFPANAQWSNLPLKPEFVPWLLRTISHIRQRPGLEGPSVVTADGVAEFALPLQWTPANGDVTDTDGRTLPLEFHRSTSRLAAAYPETSVKGYYTVKASGGRIEQFREDQAAFAVNLSPEESNFTVIDESQLRELLPDVELSFIDASAEAQQLHGSIGEVREVWRPLIWLTFVIIGIEFLLATLKGQRAEDEQGPTMTDRMKDVASGAWVGRMTGAGIEDH